MASVRVTHHGLTSDEATKPPLRNPVEPGEYKVKIVRAEASITRSSPPLTKVTVEFSIIHGIGEDGEAVDKEAGRRLFQDYILDPDPNYPGLDEVRVYELRQMLDATHIEYTDEGFDTDHLNGLLVNVKVKHRKGKTPDEDGRIPVFANVYHVDECADQSADPNDFI